MVLEGKDYDVDKKVYEEEDLKTMYDSGYWTGFTTGVVGLAAAISILIGIGLYVGV